MINYVNQLNKENKENGVEPNIVRPVKALITYIEGSGESSLVPEALSKKIISEGLSPWQNLKVSAAEGIVAGGIVGVGAHGAAAGTFVQAGFWVGVKGLLGMSSGIVVPALGYSALVFAVSIGLAVVTGASVVYGAKAFREESEKRRVSEFLADIMIAALPIAWADGEFSLKERDALEKMLLDSPMNEQNQKRVRETREQGKSFEEISKIGLLKEENPQKAKMKHCLLLCMAWKLAIADGRISSEEISLHTRMAEFMDISEEEVNEIRRLVLLQSGIDIRERITVKQGDIAQESVDAIVNSANKTLLPGRKLGWLPLIDNTKRVDTAIHQLAGSSLLKECQSLKGCEIGEAKITEGYNLPARSVESRYKTSHSVRQVPLAADQSSSE